MARLDELRLLAVDAAVRVDQVDRVELVAAVVALVAARTVVPADGAGALDVAVRQRAARARGDGAQRGALHHVAVAVHRAEHLLHHRVVVAGGGAGEQVVRQAERRQVLDDHPVVAVREGLRRDALLLGLDQDRCPVLVRARDHQHVVARHAHVAAVDVRGDAEPGDMSDVAGAVRVGPRDGREDAGHGDDPRWRRATPQRPAAGGPGAGARGTGAGRGRAVQPFVGRFRSDAVMSGRKTAKLRTMPTTQRTTVTIHAVFLFSS